MTSSDNSEDLSNGWEFIANELISIATWDIGAATVENWSSFLRPGHAILDVGCGFGGSYTQGLIDNGIEVYGVDASKTLLQEHLKRFPDSQVECESAEDSTFYGRKFDGIMAIGLMFLLSDDAQITVLRNAANSLAHGGRLLFTSPHQVCTWQDILTGRQSQSLGRDVYVEELSKHGLSLADEYTDEGENHYFSFIKS